MQIGEGIGELAEVIAQKFLGNAPERKRRADWGRRIERVLKRAFGYVTRKAKRGRGDWNAVLAVQGAANLAVRYGEKRSAAAAGTIVSEIGHYAAKLAKLDFICRFYDGRVFGLS